MLKLKNVSKFYYNSGVIATGFSRVNIEFNIGEFVAIVGESGSGKSTLLNVISGLDSYEEGEMYINGEETSHYQEIDFENYRKKYVSNIFQAFNLVNSYTVYQNIELVLLLNGYKKREVKGKILELIDKVGLNKYKNTKVSKLSGGQKQRVAIARALAKETPVIVCDEPTGNLDSKSAREVIKLLKEISCDKLVIVVTHNIKEIESLATRIVVMNDGKIISDKVNKEVDSDKKVIVRDYNGIGFINTIRLGVRNTFNIIPKFLLILIVFLFVSASLLSTYGSLLKTEYEEDRVGTNDFFDVSDDTRVILKKYDNSVFNDDDYSKIENTNYVNRIMIEDLLLDNRLYFEALDESYFGLSVRINDIKNFNYDLDYGRMPENSNEAVLFVYKNDWYFSYNLEDAINKIYYYNGNRNDSSAGIKIVGVKYYDELYGDNDTLYLDNSFLKNYIKIVNYDISDKSVYINGNNIDYSLISVSNNVPVGEAYISDDYSWYCKWNYYCYNNDLKINVSNLYYNDNINLSIKKTFNSKNITSVVGVEKNEYNDYSVIYINQSDYDKLFYKGNYQISVYVDDIDNIDNMCDSLEKLGYKTLMVKNIKNKSNGDFAKAIRIIRLVVTTTLIITLFFISYFVIKLVLKSRNVYFSILRILGANYSHMKRILDVELIVNSSLAFILYLVFILLVKYQVIDVAAIRGFVDFLKTRDYVLMYVILIVMSYLVSSRFSRKMFKDSAMETYREEI